MAECNLEQIIKSGVEKALNKPVMNGKSITQWAAIGMKAPQWVSVEERLPEESGRYICWFGNNKLIKGAEILTYVDEWKAFGSLESLETYPNVTHWMPIEPPKEADE